MTQEELDPLLFGDDQPCFGCSPTHPIGLKLRFTREADEVRTQWTPPDDFQGPPGIVHGGLVMTVADEVAAWTVVGLKRKFGFTGAVSAKLRRPVFVGRELIGRGRIADDRGRIVIIAVTLEQGGDVAFTGEFTFALLDVAAAERLLQQPLPEAWKKLARS